MEFINFVKLKEQIEKQINFINSDEFKFEKLNEFKDKITINDRELLKTYYNNGFFNIDNNEEKEIKFKLLMKLYISILKRMGILIVDPIRGYCDVLYNFNFNDVKGKNEFDIIFKNLDENINNLKKIDFGEQKLIQLMMLNRIIRTLPILGYSNISKQLTNHLIIVYNKINNHNNNNNSNNYASKIIINGRINLIYFEKDIQQSIPYTVNKFKYNNKLNTYEKYNCKSYEIKNEVIGLDEFGYLKDKNGKSYIVLVTT